MKLLDQGEDLDNTSNILMIGWKDKLFDNTRPDVPFAMCGKLISLNTEDESLECNSIDTQVLEKALGKGMLYPNYGHTRVLCFSDAGWACSLIDRLTY